MTGTNASTITRKASCVEQKKDRKQNLKQKLKAEAKEKAKEGRPRKRNSFLAGSSKLPMVAGSATRVLLNTMRHSTMEDFCLTLHLAPMILDVLRQTPTAKKFIIHFSHQLVLHHPRQAETSHRSKDPKLTNDPKFIIMTYLRYRKILIAKSATSPE